MHGLPFIAPVPEVEEPWPVLLQMTEKDQGIGANTLTTGR
jgi:hypothetical protein